jgi:hypothetical protein
MKRITLAVVVMVVALAGLKVHAVTHVTDSYCWLCALCPF